jgi:fructose-bisphosphate aldolase class 1
MVTPGKGILAADDPPAPSSALTPSRVESTRCRDYREMLFRSAKR